MPAGFAISSDGFFVFFYFREKEQSLMLLIFSQAHYTGKKSFY